MNTAKGAIDGVGLVTGPSLTLDDEGLACDYDQISARWQFIAGQVLVGNVAIKTGERVLDVGCGTGLLAQYIADITGPLGYVLGVDPLPLRIQISAARARPGLEFRVGDAYWLHDLRDASFDVVCLNAVFHWLPEKTRPLQEFARLLKSEGRLGLVRASVIAVRPCVRRQCGCFRRLPSKTIRYRGPARLTRLMSEN
jgi:ubiquinone/menaquinone biosynthesis C-methylase UbiE